MATSDQHHDDLVIQAAPPAGPGIAYATPAAFDAAIKDRIATAAATSEHSIAELRRQFAYDRFLARIFTTQPWCWVLKGGAGLLARLPSEARHSQDIDLYLQDANADPITGLRQAADSDLGDHFAFNLEPTKPLTGIHPGQRFRIIAYLRSEFAAFGLDVVLATNMTGEPEPIPNLSPITVDGLATAAYRAYPVADHIADKHAAMLGIYNDRPSTRVRDLVDLVLLATTQRPTGEALRRALMSEYAHRGLDAPAEVTLPSADWLVEYPRVAARAPSLNYRETDEALTVVKKMLDPVLTGRTTGTWDPATLAWVD